METRRKNRLFLAEGYVSEKNRLRLRGFARYPYNETIERTEDISGKPDKLKYFLERKIEETQEDMRAWRHRLRDTLGEGEGQKRADAAEKLAFIASDPEIYGNDDSAKALGELVRGASRGIAEAKEALRSLGLDADEILRDVGARAFRLGHGFRHMMRNISRRMDVALTAIEDVMEIKL